MKVKELNFHQAISPRLLVLQQLKFVGSGIRLQVLSPTATSWLPKLEALVFSSGRWKQQSSLPAGAAGRVPWTVPTTVPGTCWFINLLAAVSQKPPLLQDALLSNLGRVFPLSRRKQRFSEEAVTSLSHPAGQQQGGD